MKIVKANVEFVVATPNIGEVIERATRTCYKSHDKIKDGSAERLFNQVVKQSHHDSVTEHGSITVQITTDRAVLAQITRHRLFSFSVESQRYVNYSKDKFGGEIQVIKPEDIEEGTLEYDVWLSAMSQAETHYMMLLQGKVKPETARSVLPNSTKTEFTITGNVRQWRSFFRLRLDRHAQVDIRTLTRMVYDIMIENGIPKYFFDDIISE